MAAVRFTRHLRAHIPSLADGNFPGSTLAEVVDSIERVHPGIRGYLLDDQGVLRRHVNCFVNEELIRDRERMSDPVGPKDTVFVMQALSGG